MKESGRSTVKIIPEQKTGSKTGATAAIELNSREEAVELFQKARHRLLNVNSWDEYSGIASAVFELRNKDGEKLSRPPQTGDLIRIDLPGPGTVSGKGYDWVRIEAIEDNSNSDKEDESFAFRVRPVKSPVSSDDAPAHFYTDDATSTFVIERHGNTVSAAEIGRNEVSNTESDSVADKIRNTLVAAGAKNGLAYPQWKSLMEGLLKKEND